MKGKHVKGVNDAYQGYLTRALELLPDDEVELASAALPATPAVNRVKPVCPVNPHKANHWQEDTCTHAGRPFQVKRVDVPGVPPRVTRLQERDRVDGGVGFKDQGVSYLQAQAGVGTRLRGYPLLPLRRCFPSEGAGITGIRRRRTFQRGELMLL